MGSNTIKINGKVILIAILILLIIGAGIFVLGKSYWNGGSNNGADIQFDSENVPDECRLPAGQDVNSWKEHLGHHAETQDCLRYFE